jgi:hypothetical protein
MTTIIGGSSPSITFSDSTTQTTAFTSTPSVTSITTSGDSSINGLTVGKGGGAVSNNTVVGSGAMAATATGGDSVAIGLSALAAMTSGSSNVGIGSVALTANDTGANNVGVGVSSLRANTSGGSNTALGVQSLRFNTTASYNTAVGYQAGYNTTNANVTAIGYQALYSNTTSRNTAVGSQAGYAVTTGDSGIFIGQQAGNNLTTGYAGVYLGATSQASAVGAAYENVIGSGLTGKGNSTTFIGNQGGGACYQGNNSAAWSVASDRRLKKNIVDNAEGLDIISQIRVRNFEYRLPEEVTELEQHNAIQKTGVQLGVIAQELQEVCGDCVKTESTGVMSVNQENITWHLVNAIKDLKTIVDAQAAEIAELKAKVA